MRLMVTASQLQVLYYRNSFLLRSSFYVFSAGSHLSKSMICKTCTFFTLHCLPRTQPSSDLAMSKSSSPRIPTMISAAVSQDISNIVLALPDCGTAVLVGQKQSDTAANRSCCSSSNSHVLCVDT